MKRRWLESGAKIYGALVFVLIILAAMPGTAGAHGLLGNVSTENAMVVTMAYDDGEPMSYAKIEIRAAGDKLPFQSGRTDRNGRFVFLPDQPGEWIVVAADGMGHRLELKAMAGVHSAQGAGQPHQATTTGNLTKIEKILMGITMIFGICGAVFWWHGRRMRRAAESS